MKLYLFKQRSSVSGALQQQRGASLVELVAVIVLLGVINHNRLGLGRAFSGARSPDMSLNPEAVFGFGVKTFRVRRIPGYSRILDKDP